MLGLDLSIVPLGKSGVGPSAGPVAGTLVFTLIGQSNMVGRAAFDGGPLHPAGTRQWGRAGGADGQLVAATVPLQHHDPNPGQMGLDIAFAEAFATAYPGATLVLVPSADGGTGFSDNRWNPGDDLYADAVARTNAVMAENPGFTFAGFLWHQGEKDVGFAGYAAALDGMITALRQDVAAAGPATPFVLGGLVPGWVGANGNRAAIQATIETTPARLDAIGFASSDSLTASGVDVHFAASDLRSLGTRYFAAWQAFFSGQTVPLAQGAIPDQTDLLPGAGTESGSEAPLATSTIPDQFDSLGLTAPTAVGTIPDQADSLGLAAPAAVDTIPDQQDFAA